MSKYSNDEHLEKEEYRGQEADLSTAHEKLQKELSPLENDATTFKQLEIFNKKGGKFDEQMLRELHKIALGAGTNIYGGIFRGESGENPGGTIRVGDHIAPTNGQVPSLLKKFINWLNEEEQKIGNGEGMGLQNLAGEAHVRFSLLHPYGNGNGRACRALVNLLMLRHGRTQFVIPEEFRQQYNLYLGKTDQTDFLKLMARCVQNYTGRKRRDRDREKRLRERTRFRV
uniref:Fido domain-containing protein n=1 Tax=Globodera rostochiensis TaxID=31243 RepID=A0A914H5W6_GLORO